MIPDAAAQAVTTQASRGAGAPIVAAAAYPRLTTTPHGRSAALDGVRGVAIALVVGDHFAQTVWGLNIPVGFALSGVTVFFVLSGYLITGLLLREAPLDLRNFYLRRVVRLAPALLAMLAFAAVVGILTGTEWIPGVARALLYIANVDPNNAGLVGHAWSLSIEEQFYALWPLVILLARRWLLPLALVGAVLGVATYSADTYYATLNNGGAILAGAALAISARRLPRVGGAVGVALIVVSGIFWQQWMAVAGTVVLIASASPVVTPLAPIGLRAYSLYLWNIPLLHLLGPIGILPTFLVAECSYRYLEQPIIRRFRASLAPGVRGGSRSGDAVAGAATTR